MNVLNYFQGALSRQHNKSSALQGLNLLSGLGLDYLLKVKASEFYFILSSKLTSISKIWQLPALFTTG